MKGLIIVSMKLTEACQNFWMKLLFAELLLVFISKYFGTQWHAYIKNRSTNKLLTMNRNGSNLYIPNEDRYDWITQNNFVHITINIYTPSTSIAGWRSLKYVSIRLCYSIIL